MAEKDRNKADERSVAEKKKIQGFLHDVLRFGSVKGFRYFDMSLRGREELLLNVQNEQYHSSSVNRTIQLANIGKGESGGEDQSSFDFNKNLPRNYESLILSSSTQKMLSGFHFLEIGLPPASPCSSEISPRNENTTLFLLAAYARYKCPYVWVRSNHDRLVRLSECEAKEQLRIKDSPLKLKTVSEWSVKDLRIWDIIAEIVRMNVVPAPRNPFAANHLYFDSLPLDERIIASGAMVYFLQHVLMQEHSYNALVSEDLHELLKMHFKSLQELAISQKSNSQYNAGTGANTQYNQRTIPEKYRDVPSMSPYQYSNMPSNQQNFFVM